MLSADVAFDIDLKEPVLTQKCRMTLDEAPYYNPDAVPFCLEQPLTMPGEETFRQRKQEEKIRYCDCNRDMSRHKRSRRFMKRH